MTNKLDAKDLYVRLTAIKCIDYDAARERLKTWVKGHRAVVYKTLEDMAAAPQRMEFVKGTYHGKYATLNDTIASDAYSPKEISQKVENGILEYLWLTESALYVRISVTNYYKEIVEPLVPSDNPWRGEGVGPFWERVITAFVENNIWDFDAELQDMGNRICLMLPFTKDIPDFITPLPQGQEK